VTPENSEQTRWVTKEVLPHRPALRAYLFGRFPTLPDVDDLVQESLVRTMQAHEHGDVTSPKALLFSIARNLALDVMRRQQVIKFEPITELSDPSVYTDNVDVAESVSRKQEFDLLTKAIQSLPERCRQVVTLRTAYGLSQRQVAEKLGISENTVEKQMSNGIRRCSEYFARLGLP
jgi:RNA polymerase sigma-70 factor (ECF subfamily)